MKNGDSVATSGWQPKLKQGTLKQDGQDFFQDTQDSSLTGILRVLTLMKILPEILVILLKRECLNANGAASALSQRLIEIAQQVGFVFQAD
jgi:hypothetical protein